MINLWTHCGTNPCKCYCSKKRPRGYKFNDPNLKIHSLHKTEEACKNYINLNMPNCEGNYVELAKLYPDQYSGNDYSGDGVIENSKNEGLANRKFIIRKKIIGYSNSQNLYDCRCRQVGLSPLVPGETLADQNLWQFLDGQVFDSESQCLDWAKLNCSSCIYC